MAQCKQTPQEFIKNAFTPQIGVITSSLVEQICQKNNLSFVDLCQPFCKLNSDVHYKDPNGTVITIRNLKITFSDVDTKPPQPVLARKFLNSAVTDAQEARTQTLHIGEYMLEIPSTAPWFEAWRDTFLQVQFPSDHEYTKHFLACILAVSSTDADPVESMINLAQTLNQMQNVSSTKMPKWFTSDILRYYIIVHDNTEGSDNSALQSFEAMKTSYGAGNCFLLKVNSRPPGHVGEQLPDPWSQFISSKIDSRVENKQTLEDFPVPSQGNNLELGQEANESGNTLPYHPLSPDIDDHFLNDSIIEKDKSIKKSNVNTLHGCCLSTNDVEEVKLFIHEFCTRALLPYVEQLTQHLSESVSNKKGVSRSLFSATKRWFSPNKPGSTIPANNVVYSPESPELQMRRLGDLYFMFGHYSLSYQAYHSAKRDFNADQAWLHYAGALEMASLAAFMANESNRKTFDYMEESITTYLNVCNKMVQFATRATLLSAECLKGNNLYGEAAHQLIRMTSEESDLRSALLLEQAGYCFLQSKPSMVRKYAFHMVLAGHRFSKAAQKKHSLRSYKQAYQVYNGKGWGLAEDHIHYAVGKQANNLGHLTEAVQSFAKLLYGQSRQTVQQQTLFLKEYLTICSVLQKTGDNKEFESLHLPVLVNESVRVLVGPTPPLTTPGKIPATGITLSNQDNPTSLDKWNKLEEMLVQEVQGSLPLLFKPAVSLYTIDNIGLVSLTAITSEPIQVSIRLCNPLQIPLNLQNVYLLWDFETNNNFISNVNDDRDIGTCIKTHYLKSVVLQANCCQELTVIVTPLLVGKLTIKGICYNLVNPINHDENIIMVKGKQLFDMKQCKKLENKTEIKQLDITIVPPAPCLQVTFSDISSEVLCNEIQKVTVNVHNIGTIPLHNIYMASSVPELISTCEFTSGTHLNDNVETYDLAAAKERYRRRNYVTPLMKNTDKLEPGRLSTYNLWLRAPEQKGPAVIDLLIYYENVDSNCIPRYRLVRHIWQLSVQESVSVESVYQQSLNSKAVEQVIFSIKVTNSNQIHHTILTEISLLKVALLSTKWLLLNETTAPKDVVLHSQETIHLMLKGRRNLEREEMHYSEFIFNPKQALCNDTSRAYLDFAKKSTKTETSIFNDVQISRDVSLSTEEGILLFVWQAHVVDAGNKKIVTGQNLVNIPRLNTQDIQKSDSNKPVIFTEDVNQFKVNADEPNDEGVPPVLQKKVIYNLIHPSVLYHSFQETRLCVVSVQLLLHSVTSTHSVSVTVNTLGTNSTTSSFHKPYLYNPFSSKYFRWIGKGRIVKVLEPFCSERIELLAAVFAPGTYDLGARIEILCHRTDEPQNVVLETCRIDSALIVISSNS